MIVIIAGTRTFDQFQLLCEYCDSMLKNQVYVHVITGYDPKNKKFQGADQLGKRYAEMRGYKYDSFPADWNTYGKSAGPIRNGQMAFCAHALIAFWDGKSKGTLNMMEQARDRDLKIRVKRYK